MSKLIWSGVCAFLFTLTLSAQIPQIGVLDKADSAGLRSDCNLHNAGTVNLNLTGMSNDIEFLCFSDVLEVRHNMDQNLCLDPDPTTAQGVNYVFYDCAPTVTGLTLTDVIGDCTVQNPTPANSVWIVDPMSGINQLGDINFFNDGGVQAFFAMGNPIELFFAPVTIDDWMGGTWEGGGQCVKVSTNSAFRVVYLNEITAFSIENYVQGSSCNGRFGLRGGLPEFDGSGYSNISITMQGNPGVTGTITTQGLISNDSLVEFSVPMAGMYDVIVDDGKSCGASFTIDMTNCGQGGLELSGSNVSGNPGDTVCVDITVDSDITLFSFQSSIVYDSLIIRLVSVVDNFPNNPAFIASPVNLAFQTDEGTINFSWDDSFVVGANFAQGTSIMTFCFEIVGNPGECAPLEFVDGPVTLIDVRDANGDPVDLIVNSTAKVNVLDPSSNLVVTDTLINDVSCNGLGDGNIDLTVTGGSGAYTFMWSNGDMTEDIFSLGGGNYTVTITDANNPGLQLIETYTIVDPPALSASFQNIVAATCDSTSLVMGSNGAADIVVSGGTGMITAQWDNNIFGLSNLNLTPGDHTVTVTDANGCELVSSVLIPSPPPVTISLVDSIPPMCNGDLDGTLSVTAVGGTGMLMYQWDDMAMTTGPSLANIGAGTYTVDVSDANGCLYQETYSLNEPNPINAVLDMTNTTDVISCSGTNDGQIIILTTGGSAPYTYVWDPPVSSLEVATQLGAGLYTINVTDANGCSAPPVIHRINSPSPIQAIVPEPIPPACPGDPTFITVDTVFGGAGNMPSDYTFSVDNGPQRPIMDSVMVLGGPHFVTVFDGSGCSFEIMVNAVDPPPLLVELGGGPQGIVEIDLGDGHQINPIVAANAPIVQFDWDPIGPELVCLDSLCSRVMVSPLTTTTYTLTITDENGCTATDDIKVDINNTRNVYVPNVFSPNGDGFNDIFRPRAGQGIQQINFMRVFDRWGNMVFEAENFLPSDTDLGSVGWDGKFGGKFMNPGVFVFVVEVEFIDGRILLYRGDVTLIRE